ncbi:hypothetical protein FA10DRAFT_263215 [Acaromyces ingoldii]|uniref:Uncharacterized protein n=1 Tax=Acaromyces ingoldii TaxID=215250 RepID=A0A316YF79_9BASI|nr:hypothetical protein FA10DRAFT_263215 [Acaromyces ingoldii]PWN86713.1 hypothetical protein FA10DRAFT_263215 [Acaromyces ingoldii]
MPKTELTEERSFQPHRRRLLLSATSDGFSNSWYPASGMRREDWTQTAISTSDLFEHSSQSLDRSSRVSLALRSLGHAESLHYGASQDVNSRYFEFGHAYANLIVSSATSSLDYVASKGFHDEAYPALLKILQNQRSEPANYAGLRKRAERARKFFIVAHLFGISILERAELINVSKIDTITFAMLSSIMANHMDMVQRIKQIH